MSIRAGLRIVKKANEPIVKIEPLKVRVEILKDGFIDLEKIGMKKYEFKKLPFREKEKIIKLYSNIETEDEDVLTDIEVVSY